MNNERARWTFFSNHAHVLFYLHSHPKDPLRRVASAVGITERAVQSIVADLENSGYLRRTKVGRQNEYSIDGNAAPLRHPLEAHRSLDELLNWVQTTELVESDLVEDPALENWTVGEHGSEV